MAETKKTTGGCLCGAVRYETTAASEWTWYCHCESCRRHTGAQPPRYTIFLIHKRTFGEAAANDRFWPIPAVRQSERQRSRLGVLIPSKSTAFG
jgi:hypothetical protein